jgi:hypothetical protein
MAAIARELREALLYAVTFGGDVKDSAIISALIMIPVALVIIVVIGVLVWVTQEEDRTKIPDPKKRE